LYAVVALILLGGFIAAIMVIVKNANDANIEYQVYEATTGEATPTHADASNGFYVDQDGAVGGTAPPDAVRVDVYTDPLCPICRQFELATSAELAFLQGNGEIALYFHPIAILNRYSQGTRYPTRAVSALATVSEYDPSHFMAFVTGLFANQPAENTKGLTNVEIADVARTAGVSEETIAKIPDGEFTQWVTASTEQSSVDGVGGTPTLRIGGVDYLGWSAQGNISGAVAYVREYGAEAFQAALDEAATAAATPAPSVSS
jgi:protein-disulfide isomerase